MLTRVLLGALLLLLVFRAIGRLIFSIAEGMSGAPPRGGGAGRGARGSTTTPVRGEIMARDPVCGTYVVPSRALSARGKDGTVYFCSDTCRQSYLSH